MATQTAKRKPVFVKADQLKPGTSGHTLTVKVVSSSPVKTVPSRGGRSSVIASRPSRIAECIVGDETAVIIFTARNEQGMICCVLRVVHSITFFCVCVEFQCFWICNVIDILLGLRLNCFPFKVPFLRTMD